MKKGMRAPPAPVPPRQEALFSAPDLEAREPLALAGLLRFYKHLGWLD